MAVKSYVKSLYIEQVLSSVRLKHGSGPLAAAQNTRSPGPSYFKVITHQTQLSYHHSGSI